MFTQGRTIVAREMNGHLIVESAEVGVFAPDECHDDRRTTSRYQCIRHEARRLFVDLEYDRRSDGSAIHEKVILTLQF